jgi:histidinol-phosphate aminotransferase
MVDEYPNLNITNLISVWFSWNSFRNLLCIFNVIAVLNKPPYSEWINNKELWLADKEKIQLEIDSIIIQRMIYLKF